MIITNPPRHLTFGHNWVQPDWPNLTLPYLANYFPNPKIVDNSQRFHSPQLKDPAIISIRSEKEYPIAVEMIKKNNIVLAGGQAATNHKEELLYLGVGVSSVTEAAIDDRPFPKWELVPRIKSHYFKGRYTGSLEMSRGCPHKCSFCAITQYWKNFEQKSNDRIIEELLYLKSLNMTHIYLTDDNFGVNTEKHKDLLNRIKPLDMKFFAQIRASTIVKHPELIKLAAEVGFYGFLIGFDTYSSTIFKEETKNSSADMNIIASETCRENNIAIYGCHIYGLPSQDRPEDFETTFQMGRKHSDLFVMSFFNPMQGTEAAKKPIYREGIWQTRYGEYYKRHQFSISEIAGALFHPNSTVRKFKQGGYKKYFAYKLS